MKLHIIHILVLSFLFLGCTATPIVDDPTQTPIPVTNTPEPTTSSPSTPTDELVQSADLSGFASAWSRHDDGDIRDFYSENARYFTEYEITKLTTVQLSRAQ